ncbi:MAG: cellulase family glycosylhydrolase [Solirubrobacteraceae bacterium]
MISGTAVQGDALSTTNGTWSNSPTGYAYKWSDCSSIGTGCVPISGVASLSYTLASSDVGSTIVVTVTAANAGGSTSASSAATVVVPGPPPTAPVNSVLPVISGSAAVGDALTVTNGSWSDPTGYTYQWSDCNNSAASCTAIRDATSASYTVATNDVGLTIEATVTASNAGGSTSASATATSTVPTSPPPAPVSTTAPSISGTPQQGSTLSASNGSWTNSPGSYGYQWQDCSSSSSCANISGATAASYTAQAADVGDTIAVVVTATNAGGSTAATSGKTAAVTASARAPAAPTSVQTSNITSSSILLSWSAVSAAASYGVELGGFSDSTVSTSYNFTLLSACASYTLGVRSVNSTGSSSWVSVNATTSGCASGPPSNTQAPAIIGSAQQGQTLTATTGQWNNEPSSYGYQWQDCPASGSCTNIPGATSSSYTVQSSDIGDKLDVVVTATNSYGSAPATSTEAAAVGSEGTQLNGIHVSGIQLVNGNGAAVVLHGVDRSGVEYRCAEGYGFTDGPSGSAEFSPMPSWGINSVFIGLNEDCWEGINGVESQYAGQNYINAVKSEVAAAEAAGLYPVIGFFWGDPGTELADNSNDPNGGGQPALPDNDHAPLFWEEVAETFKSDPNVIFRLQEEPHPDGNSSSLGAWQCWNKGSVQYSESSDSSTFGVAPTPVSSSTNCEENSTNNSITYQTVGMQSLLNIIRGTGAANVVQVPGVQYANMMACSTSESPTQCGFLDSADGVRVSDPLQPAQLMADVDVYPDGNPCGSTSCYSATYAPVIAVMPFEAGETGMGSTDTDENTFLNWMDNEHAGYFAWAWDTWGGLISDYNGTPQSPWGTDYYSHLQSLG